MKTINVIKDVDKGEVTLYVTSPSVQDILSFVTELMQKLNEDDDV